MTKRTFYPKDRRFIHSSENIQGTTLRMFDNGGKETQNLDEAYVLYIGSKDDIDYLEDLDESIKFDHKYVKSFFIFDSVHNRYKAVDDALVEAIRTFN